MPGSSPAGSSPAGYDPVGAPSTGFVVPTQVAALYQLQTKSTPLNLDGTLATVDPVDQRVALLIGVPAGTFKSAPTVGHGLAKIRSYDKALQAKVTDSVRLSLKPLLDSGDIVLLSVQARSTVPGRLEAFVTYRNTRTQKVQTI